MDRKRFIHTVPEEVAEGSSEAYIANRLVKCCFVVYLDCQFDWDY